MNRFTLFGETMLIRDNSSHVRSNRLGYLAYGSRILAGFMIVDDSDPEPPCLLSTFILLFRGENFLHLLKVTGVSSFLPGKPT